VFAKLLVMKVGIIDVGSNTIRLLAAESGRSGSVTPLCEERYQVGLGDVIERRGRIPDAKLSETAECARAYAKLARRIGCDRLEVVVTAPGRQSSNAGALLTALADAAGVAPRVLSAESEGRLAYLGAVSAADQLPALVAVCDVGGGSTEIAFGLSAADADWVDSIDTGSLRLTSRFFGASSGRSEVRAAGAEVRGLLAEIEEPRPQAALATGGSARALRRLVGRSLGATELEQAIDALTGRTPEKIARKHGIELRRARTLLAGAVILSEVSAKLGVPLEVARGGMREGLAAEMLAQLAAA
jgi:exopolyphosphatase/guanosine-5'-triphosphate,3'-diphosphate pyrophosphatase